MLEIDGSYGEGGGQILRTAIAMASVHGIEIKIKNIRANRPNPGLSHQHLMAVKAAKELTNAEVKGLSKGSTTVTFKPSTLRGGFYRFDIGTAGSITLLLQTVLPPAILADEDISIEVKGGTDVKWSPPYDYFENVFIANLKEMGIDIKSELIKRGHYPKGGGKIKVEIRPSNLSNLNPGEEIEKIVGKAFVTNLPDHITDRMKRSALKELIEYPTSISKESYESESAGTAITLWTTGGRHIGCGVLGEKGVPAEDIGKEVAEKIKEDIDVGIDIDQWSADQIIPFLSLIEDSGELITSKKTGHLESNIWVVNQFPGNKINLVEEELVKITY